MQYFRAFVVVVLVALAGTGGGLIIINLKTSSPRLMVAGIAAAVIGIIGGGLALGRSFEHIERDRELRERFATPPRERELR
jgi:di/tricarboxylate transporter